MTVRNGFVLLLFSLLVMLGHALGVVGIAQIGPNDLDIARLIGLFGLTICIVAVASRFLFRGFDGWLAGHGTPAARPTDAAPPSGEPAGSDADEVVIRESGAFDAEWYLSRYPDVASAGIDPVTHFVAAGAAEGRDPNPYFQTTWYLDRNPDVRDAGVNAFVHYLQQGSGEGRAASPDFDTRFYLSRNEDVRTSGVLPLQHYMTEGVKEGREPVPPGSRPRR